MFVDLPARKAAAVTRSRTDNDRDQPATPRERRANKEAIKMDSHRNTRSREGAAARIQNTGAGASQNVQPTIVSFLPLIRAA